MKLLYICTHNRCRSIICEAVTREHGAGLLEARSAGSSPAGEVHPLTLSYLLKAGYRTTDLHSKSWDVHADWSPDCVITVCDRAAGEACPLYFTKATTVHWGLADPSAVVGSQQQIESAFSETIKIVEQRVAQLQAVARLPRSQWPGALAELVGSA